MDTLMKQFFEKCQESVAEGQNVEFAEEAAADGEYALVREISEDEEFQYIQILASGDLDGVSWMYDQACEFFDDFQGGIMEMDDYYRYGEKVDFH